MTEGKTILEHFYQKVLHDPEVLEKNVEDFPYCSFASLLLLYHYKKTKNPLLEEQARKNAIYFYNTDWLQLLLNREPADLPLPGTRRDNESEEIERKPKETLMHQELNRGNGAAINQPGEIVMPVGEIQQSKTLEPLPEASKPTPEWEPLMTEENIATEPPSEKEEEDPEISPDHESPLFQFPGPNEKSPSTEILFEPLHTVDYFASIGVKIDNEIVKNDKLSRQMKSFTEWLKGMKKIHPDKLENQDIVLEKIVQTSADESNINTEILTEAMAEVLIKQNKKDKAIEMFNKLSLINPAKSAYFAAKIESIKSS